MILVFHTVINQYLIVVGEYNMNNTSTGLFNFVEGSIAGGETTSFRIVLTP